MRIKAWRRFGSRLQVNRLFLFDVDSTLINEEVIELLAAHAAVQDQVALITSRAMAGELDFESSLRERVGLLKGLSTNVIAEVQKKITLTNGAAELISTIQKAGDIAAVVSGGFDEVITPLMSDLGVTNFRANQLEIIDGTLTGQVTGKVVDRATKAKYLLELKDKYSPGKTFAIGDGANDIDMINTADCGIAFCAKPALNEVADVVILKRDLREVLNYL